MQKQLHELTTYLHHKEYVLPKSFALNDMTYYSQFKNNKGQYVFTILLFKINKCLFY